MTERRRSERYTFSTPASLESGGARSSGALLDVSAEGVRMRLDGPSFLDQTCTFTAVAFGVRLPGRIVWRRGREVGIRFLAGVTETPVLHAFGRRRLQG